MSRFLCRIFKVLAGACSLTVLAAVSCTEQGPERFQAPGFGKVEVSVSGFRATVQCRLSNAESSFSYGFILKGNGDGSPRTIPLEPKNGLLRTEIKGLDESCDYSIHAFADNGINRALSEEEHFSTPGAGSVINMPDSVFCSIILNEYDSNDDGQLSPAEAAAISNIKLSTDNIADLAGIEYFTNLESLICRGSGTDKGKRTGRLTRVDLSRNKNLRHVEVDGNNISELILPANTSNIEEIHCIENKIESLDLSGCPKLRLLYCWCNNLSSIDVSACPYLRDLRCAQNDFSNGLDLSANEELRILACNNTFMQDIDVSANKELVELMCWDNAIKDIDISNNKELLKLECSNNLLKQIDLSHNSQLNILTCRNNFLKELDLSHNPDLTVLSCDNNLLTNIDIAMLVRLKDLSVGDNNISETLDLSRFKNLTNYGGNNLPLKAVPDFTQNPNLESIHICGSGGALYIDESFFRNFPDIKDFNICCYPGDSLDLSLNSKMCRLWMSDMPNVRILDLSASPHLSYICINEDGKLEKVYVHKDVDISRLEIEAFNCNASIEHKQ